MKRAILLLFAMAVMGCSGGAEKPDEEPELIGAPPPPSEDPFYFKTMPAEAVPAQPSGSIGAEERQSRAAVEPASSVRCFSCVKICPEADRACERGDDVICGWGVHPDQSTASKLATAECDGALDVARQMPKFSTISGACPRATCRMPEQ